MQVHCEDGVPAGICLISFDPRDIEKADAAEMTAAARRCDHWFRESEDSPAVELEALISIFEKLGQDAAELAIARAVKAALDKGECK